jgi:oxygen-independent coproporphyrinogen-3 oxidase
MAGIYIHIPFCKKACHYCNFHFSTSATLLNDFVKALLKETALRKDYINERVSTIYFGGGTPSLLSAIDLKLVIDTLYKTYNVDDNAEVTLEANPDDITADTLTNWKAIGINRLSIGIQSFFEDDLKWMNRAHNAAQAINCIKLAQSSGFNLSIDLIYGTPSLTNERWEQNVEQAVELNIPHLSCYALTVEPGTALDKMIALHKTEKPDAEKQAHHFELLMQWMNTAGYEHYEISNFAKPGFRSKHNSSYWQGKSYLGFGPSAHSFNGHSRQWNIANNATYIKSLQQGNLSFEIEELTATQQLNEYVMTSLRTNEGTSLKKVEEKWGAHEAQRLVSAARRHLKYHSLALNDFTLQLTAKGKLLADGITADLFE